MPSEPPFQPSARPAAPPTSRVPFAMPPPPPAWPVVIGVIAIVFGGGGILAGAAGLVSLLAVAPMMPAVQQGMPAFDKFQRAMTLLTAVNVFVAVPLLVAGVGLVRRARWSVMLARVWAVVRMAAVLLGVVVAMMLQPKQAAVMAAQGTMPPGMGGFLSAMTVASSFFALILGWALPVFMLAWLGRAKIRAEVAGWK